MSLHQSHGGFPGGSGGKESACSAGDRGSIPGSGRCPGGGHGSPLQYSWASLVAQTEKYACSTGDSGVIPGSGRSPGGGHGSPLQYSCLENPVDRGVWRATVHRVAKSQTQLSDRALTHVPDSLPCKGSPSSGSSQALKKFPCAHTCGTETLHGRHPWVPPPAVVSSPKYIPSRRSAQVVPAS